MTTTQDTGIHRERWHEIDSSRYAFDSRCSASEGWAQVDTESDAWYYGAWANPKQLRIVTYTEGDICLSTANSPDEFVDELRRMSAWHTENNGWMKIDGMCRPEIIEAFEALGLGDLMH